MKRFLFVFAIVFTSLIAAFASAGETADKFQEVTVPNFDTDGPACRVRFPATEGKCASEGCEFAPPKTSSLRSVQLSFSCGPTSAPTGFENPPEDADVRLIHARNAQGFVRLMDGSPIDVSRPVRELAFCLFGEKTVFCGGAITWRLEDGKKADASEDVIKFLKTMILIDTRHSGRTSSRL